MWSLGKLEPIPDASTKPYDSISSLKALIYLFNPKIFKNYNQGVDYDHKGDITIQLIAKEAGDESIYIIRCGESKRKSKNGTVILVSKPNIEKAKSQLNLNLSLLKSCLEFIVYAKTDPDNVEKYPCIKMIPKIDCYSLVGLLFTHGNEKSKLGRNKEYGISYERVEIK
eukprot:NODE_258_length_12622_cov_0.213767.p4 type:complete len:169 gc:universal NODE_258_length_12622_cov_0.213767:236-742(+)